MVRYIGTTDENTTCDKCGRIELKSTIVLATLDADGNDDGILYYGSSCAARALGGKSSAHLNAARSAGTRTANELPSALNTLAAYETLTGADRIDAFFARNPHFRGERHEALKAVREIVAHASSIVADARTLGLAV